MSNRNNDVGHSLISAFEAVLMLLKKASDDSLKADQRTHVEYNLTHHIVGDSGRALEVDGGIIPILALRTPNNKATNQKSVMVVVDETSNIKEVEITNMVTNANHESHNKIADVKEWLFEGNHKDVMANPPIRFAYEKPRTRVFLRLKQNVGGTLSFKAKTSNWTGEPLTINVVPASMVDVQKYLNGLVKFDGVIKHPSGLLNGVVFDKVRITGYKRYNNPDPVEIYGVSSVDSVRSIRPIDKFDCVASNVSVKSNVINYVEVGEKRDYLTVKDIEVMFNGRQYTRSFTDFVDHEQYAQVAQSWLNSLVVEYGTRLSGSDVMLTITAKPQRKVSNPRPFMVGKINTINENPYGHYGSFSLTDKDGMSKSPDGDGGNLPESYHHNSLPMMGENSELSFHTTYTQNELNAGYIDVPSSMPITLDVGGNTFHRSFDLPGGITGEISAKLRSYKNQELLRNATVESIHENSLPSLIFECGGSLFSIEDAIWGEVTFKFNPNGFDRNQFRHVGNAVFNTNDWTITIPEIYVSVNQKLDTRLILNDNFSRRNDGLRNFVWDVKEVTFKTTYGEPVRLSYNVTIPR